MALDNAKPAKPQGWPRRAQIHATKRQINATKSKGPGQSAESLWLRNFRAARVAEESHRTLLQTPTEG
eukprot:2719589-Alexandrium_andersonii.AAC.1